MARMSIEESLAARRRTSETRCWSEEVERKLILMLYAPPEALLQSAAAVANDPDGSGKTYQLSVTGPLPDEPQPARANAPRTAIALLRMPKPSPSGLVAPTVLPGLSRSVTGNSRSEEHTSELQSRQY